MSAIGGAVGLAHDPAEVGRRMIQTLTPAGPRTPLVIGHHSVLCAVEGPAPDADTSVASSGSQHLLFDGYLHNRDEIARDAGGGREATGGRRSVADLVLDLIVDRGDVAALRALDGSFALAVWDEVEQTMLLSSDRFASRPLFWALFAGGRGLAVGPRVQTVLQAPEVARALDPQAAHELLHYQRVHGTRTLARDVAMLAPGTLLRWRRGSVGRDTWFRAEYAPEEHDRRYWIAALADAFEVAVDRTVGERSALLLSGGLDARMAVAATKRPVRCIHFNETINREHRCARAIAAARGFPFDDVERPEDHYEATFDRAVDIGSGLYAFAHAHSIGLLPAPPAQTLIHGFAPELYFRGTNLPHSYRTFAGRQVSKKLDVSLTPAGLPEQMAKRLKYSLASRSPEQYFVDVSPPEFRREMVESVTAQVEEARGASDQLHDWFTWPDTHYHAKYPSFLFELALRPYAAERSLVFHNHVLDLHLSMPVAIRSNSQVWKGALRRLHPQVARIADANTGHSPFMPWHLGRGLDVVAGLGRRASSRVPRLSPAGRSSAAPANPGSWPDFAAHIRSGSGLTDVVRSTIADPGAIDPGVFDVPRLAAAFDDHVAGRADHQSILLLVATYGRWRKKHGPS